jgi:hypothetical protein
MFITKNPCLLLQVKEESQGPDTRLASDQSCKSEIAMIRKALEDVELLGYTSSRGTLQYDKNTETTDQWHLHSITVLHLWESALVN